jgi:hypothetical protein
MAHLQKVSCNYCKKVLWSAPHPERKQLDCACPGWIDAQQRDALARLEMRLARVREEFIGLVLEVSTLKKAMAARPAPKMRRRKRGQA